MALLNDIRESSHDGAPGTVVLQDAESLRSLVLCPQPTADPNDPLVSGRPDLLKRKPCDDERVNKNWSWIRKTINYTIIAFFALMVFAMYDASRDDGPWFMMINEGGPSCRLDIGPVVWQDYNDQLGISFDALNSVYASQCAGLAIGCVLFIPFALKYGRRPVYIVTTFVIFLTAIWQAVLRDLPNMIAANLISGLAGAVSEALVQMTIADLFFLHQRGRMNAIYVLCVNSGALLAPVAAGFSADAQGWPWIFWWCAILLGVNLVAFIFCYEETKYMTVTYNCVQPRTNLSPQPIERTALNDEKDSSPSTIVPEEANLPQDPMGSSHLDTRIPLKSYSQRMALVTKTPGTVQSFMRHVYQPFTVLLTIPAVGYTALQYGSMLSWFSVITVTESQYFSEAPYNFNTRGIGLLNIAPFVGSLIGAVYSGHLSDRSIVWLARWNNGIYEPEMRLYLAIPPIVLAPAGLFIYGYSLSRGHAWIIPCVGVGIYGFAQAAIFSASLTYLVDSYEEILGDALVAVAFVRNGLAAGITYATGPWVAALGLWGTTTLMGCMALGIGLLTVAMIIWGKRMRIASAARYVKYAGLQFAPRGN